MAIDRSQNRSARIGTLIVLGIVAFAGLTFFIPDLARLIKPSIEIVAVMPDAGSLEKGAPVWIGGQAVGTVTLVDVRGLTADSLERVAVHLQIPKKYAVHVRRDSEARITTERLIGTPLVDILPGSPAALPIHDHDTLQVRPGGTIEVLLNKTIALGANFHTMFQEAAAFQKTAVNRTREMKRLNANFTAANLEFRKVMAALEASPMHALSDRQWRAIMDHLMATSGEMRDALHAAAQRARKARSDAQPSLERLMARADTITAQIAALRASLSEGAGLMARAQRDSAIVKGIHEAQVQLDSLMVESKRNPLRFWF